MSLSITRGEVLVSTEDALREAVENGGTITLTADIVLSSRLEVSQDVTINLNGYSISCSSNHAIYISGADVTIDGNDQEGSTVTTTRDGAYAVYLTSGTLTINGGTYNGSGSSSESIYCASETTLSITDGTFNSTVHNAGGDVTISGGNFSGTVFSGIGGTLTITGGEFTGNVTSYSEMGGTTTIEIKGGEFMGNVTSNSALGGTAIIEISGGTFSGSLTCSTDENYSTATITISGGTFYNYEPASNLIAKGYTITKTTDEAGTDCWVVEPE